MKKNRQKLRRVGKEIAFNDDKLELIIAQVDAEKLAAICAAFDTSNDAGKAALEAEVILVLLALAMLLTRISYEPLNKPRLHKPHNKRPKRRKSTHTAMQFGMPMSYHYLPRRSSGTLVVWPTAGN